MGIWNVILFDLPSIHPQEVRLQEKHKNIDTSGVSFKKARKILIVDLRRSTVFSGGYRN